MLILGERARGCRGVAKLGSQIMLMGQCIERGFSHDHVGVTLYAALNVSDRSTRVVSKLRGGLMSIAGRSIDIKSISCVTATDLYNYIVIQSVLYGCELWSNLNNTDIERMEVGHRFCLKFIQSVPCRSCSVLVESMANSYSIRVMTNVKKLLFLGRLCRLQCDILAKPVFMERLFQAYPAVRRVVKSSGIVSDVLQITSKYRLCNYIEQLLNGVSFPCKKHWRDIVYEAVDEVVIGTEST